MSSLCHVIDEKMEVTPMISIDPHSIYHFGYRLFLSLPDLTTKVNSFDDLEKKIGIFLLNRLRTLLKLVTHYTSGHERTRFAMG